MHDVFAIGDVDGLYDYWYKPGFCQILCQQSNRSLTLLVLKGKQILTAFFFGILIVIINLNYQAQ